MEDRTRSRTHILTVVVEDYFQHQAFGELIHPERWRRFEARVAANTRRALDLLDEAGGIKATFFVLGWIAEEMPEVVREVAARGHEVATKGFYHRTIEEMTPASFREDLCRSRDAIQRACGLRVLGHRVARGTFTSDHLWALDILTEEGFAYDSSVFPRLWSIADEPWRRYPHIHRYRGRQLWEMPLSSWGPDCLMLPIAGGNYFRQLPDPLVRRAVAEWDRTCDAPFNLYFHVWELDPDLPRIAAAGLLTRIRQYRNLDKMPALLRDYFRQYRFQPIAKHLGLEQERIAVEPLPAPGTPPEVWTRPTTPCEADRLPVTIVVPVFNEEKAIPYLSNTLEEMLRDLGQKYDLSFVFVDDGSTDRTWDLLGRHFGTDPRFRRVRHDRNRGVAAAILTGIREAKTQIVCSIDCDCTYDPRQLGAMIPKLTDGVDMVTASPYHPDGKVLNVPAWRLGLSKGLSFLYRRILNNELATYTACFRVYRRSAVADLEVAEGGFLGVAEMLGRLDLRGSRIVEHPAVLEVRMIGHSKMKVLKTIAGHLGLLGRLAAARVVG